MYSYFKFFKLFSLEVVSKICLTVLMFYFVNFLLPVNKKNPDLNNYNFVYSKFKPFVANFQYQ